MEKNLKNNSKKIYTNKFKKNEIYLYIFLNINWK